MRRGQEFESYINSVIRDINALGWHGHKNNPNRTVKGITVKGEPFDFEIFTPYCVHVFDAKECSAKNLKWSLYAFTGTGKDARRMNSQLYILNRLNRMDYCWGYFLVWFKYLPEFRQVICFEPQKVIEAIKNEKFYLSPEDGFMWPLPEKMTVTKGDIK